MNEECTTKPSFESELENLINRYSKENESNTPDFIIAQYISGCLKSFSEAVNRRELWYGRGPVLVLNSNKLTPPASEPGTESNPPIWRSPPFPLPEQQKLQDALQENKAITGNLDAEQREYIEDMEAIKKRVENTNKL